MNILVTGANGQLGTELRNVFETNNPGQTIYTDVAELDLTEAKAIETFLIKNEITHIVNCAAYTAVDKAEEEKALCTLINEDAVGNLANAANAIGAKIIHISTDYVFDGMGNHPYKESDKVNPVSYYGTTKREGETTLLALAPKSIIIRTAWLYSPYGKNFVKTMLQLGAERNHIEVVCDQIGTPTYANDLAQAIDKILHFPQWISGVFHFSNEGVTSWYDFAKTIFRIVGIKQCEVIPIFTKDYPTAATRPYYSVLDKSLIKVTYEVDVPYWGDSLEKCIKRIQSSI